MRLTIYFLLISWALSAQVLDPFREVNSPFDEQNPVISPDGQTLFLTIANHPQNIGGRRDPGDIWISLKTGEVWSAPVHGGTLLNNALYNGVLGFSGDGSQLFLSGHYKSSGATPSTQGISVARKTTTGWSAPENIFIPYFLNRSTSLSGFYSQAHGVLLLAAESYSTTGAEDIYVSFLLEGRWSELINIGRPVNTPFQEMSPTLSEDGNELYFASNGRKGSGSFDIYVSRRLDDSWTNWSEPENLGAPINTEGRELFYRKTPSGYAVYTSTQNSDGYGDVRIFQDGSMPVNVMIPDSVKKERMSQPKGIEIKGRITDSKSGQAIAARVKFRADSTLLASGNPEGNYSIYVAPSKIYYIEVEAPGYVNLSEKLDIRNVEMSTLELNFKLPPIEVGTTVNLKSVLFEIGTTRLLEESYEELNGVVDFLKANPKVEIELEGHTDNRGDAKKNLELSQQRVDKVKSYLVSRGISPRRIKGKGYGGTRPIATNDSEEARRLNRRVEFRILKN
jgi:OOP family OmpA-OmpF porin